MVAFSGGVDSSLVALLASMASRENAIAVTADSPSLPTSELREANGTRPANRNQTHRSEDG